MQCQAQTRSENYTVQVPETYTVQVPTQTCVREPRVVQVPVFQTQMAAPACGSCNALPTSGYATPEVMPNESGSVVLPLGSTSVQTYSSGEILSTPSVMTPGTTVEGDLIAPSAPAGAVIMDSQSPIAPSVHGEITEEGTRP
jgi:hypothetical protein